MNQYLSTYQSCTGLELIRPDCQRPLISTVVNEMIEHGKQRINSGKLPIFGTIDVAVFQTPMGSVQYVVDGQHRYEALKHLYNIGYTQIPVYIMYYICNNYDEVREVFRVRNLNVVVPDYIMNSSDRITLMNEISSYLRQCSPIFCDKTNRPNIYVSDFMNKLHDSIWMRSIHNLEDFKTKITTTNFNLRLKLDNIDFKRSQTISTQMELKWNTSGIWLGVDKYYSWMNEV